MGYKFNPFTGNLDEVGAGSATTPGGSNTQVQFNDSGAFGGDADLTWNKTTNVLGITGDVNLSDGGSFTTTLQTITPTAARTISLPNATGTVALVGGSSGNLTFNNAGAYAGVANSSVDNATGNITLGSRFISSINGALSATGIAGVPIAATGTWIATGGTATTTKPQVLIEPTGTTSTGWSTSGTGLGVNAASGFAGNLLDLQVNGTGNFRVASTGTLSSNGDLILPNGGIVTSNGWAISTRPTASNGFILTWNAGLRLGGQTNIGFGNTPNTPDLIIDRDAANTLAQRSGTNAQTFRVYNTFTSATSFERAKLSWNANVLEVGTEKGSGGGTARALELQTDGTTRLTVAADGSAITATSGTALVGNHRLTGTAPASATAAGTAGDVRYDGSYIYVCTATNTWVRAALSTW